MVSVAATGGLKSALLIIGLLFSISFLIFSIVFFLHRIILQREYKIKENFNEIAQFAAANKFIYLESLAKNNIQLRALLAQLRDNKKIFDSQLDVVRKKIISLTVVNSKYLYVSGLKLSKEIRADLVKCQSMVDKLRSVSASATEYSKNVSDLIVSYRDINTNIIQFYEFNLAVRYSDPIFKLVRDKIEETITDASQYVIKFDNDRLLVLLTQLNEHIGTFYKTVLNVYTFDRIHKYLVSLQKQVKDSFKLAEKTLSSLDFSDLETTTAKDSNNINLMEKHLKLIELKPA